MSQTDEQILWKGHPSHALNFWIYLSCLLVIPIPWAIWRWILLRSQVSEITSERIRVTTGILSKRTEELELYRVRDTTFVQPFLLRLFGRGNLFLTTNDASTPALILEGIPADPALRNDLRRAIESCRDRKRARVTEFSGDLDADEPTAAGAV